jgi:hypothetical protein
VISPSDEEIIFFDAIIPKSASFIKFNNLTKQLTISDLLETDSATGLLVAND